MYICSLAMKRNFLRHLDIITKKIGILFPSSKILDQTFWFRNCHFLLEKLDKPVFHKSLKDFFHLFPRTTFENTLLVDDMPHKSMFNSPCSAIFLRHFTSLTLIVIICSTLFSCTWNHYICSECRFINL